jgi:hypothetical protein
MPNNLHTVVGGFEIETPTTSVQILTGAVDLETTGVTSPIGSIYLKSDGTL